MRTPQSPTVLGAVLAAAAVAVLFARAETPYASQAAFSQFTPLFDGKTLTHWRGDPSFWSVRDGAITGGSTRDISVNTFLIREGNFRNFELRFKYRFRMPGNSGMQIRSRLHPAHEFAVTGYQANVVTIPPSTLERFAMFWDERGRGMLAANGEQTSVTRTADHVSREVLRVVNHPERVLAAAEPYPKWNEQVVIAYENRLVNALNGMLTADVTDNDVEGRTFDGFLALQVHSGSPMEVQFKDLEIRLLTSSPDLSRFTTAPTPVPPPEPNAALSEAPAMGRDLFAQRCAVCHSNPGSNAPQQAALAQLPPTDIVDALVQGPMQPYASGLARPQIDAIAAFLTWKPGR